jgi:superfamily II DNA/RNA helicase
LEATREETETSLDDLDSLTVKELKQILKDNELDQERGILTKLKRKQDLVDYLRQNLAETVTGGDFEDDDDEDDESSSAAPPVGIELAEDDFSIVDNDDGETVKNTPSPTTELIIPPPTTTTTKQSYVVPGMRLSPELAGMIPQALQEKMVSRGITSLLPIQQASFESIYQGKDSILQSPTGSGKTLAFVLPLLSASKQRPWQRKKVASPRILTICPSRELAKQVGKEYEKLAGKAFGVVTVFGGVPLERHVALLKYKPQIVVCTPGRLRELVREGHLDYSQISTLVIDEADLLLDKGDSPDLFAAIEDIEQALEDSEEEDPEYQMVLVSATIGENVKIFAKEMEFPKSAFVKVDGNIGSKTLVGGSAPPTENGDSATAPTSPSAETATTVGHWHMSCKASVRPDIASNLISVLSPRLTIVFVPTKTETEYVASFLSEKASGTTIRILHGDMSQSARTRCIAMIREDASRKQHDSLGDVGQILVATDVASRGLDLPNVDLVVQFGLPRIAGKEGTINPELYAHRTGRTGRFKNSSQGSNDNNWRSPSNRYQTSNAVALYDPAEGEGRLVQTLVEEVKEDLGVIIKPMAIPSAARVVDAAYARLSSDLIGDETTAVSPSELAEYFRTRMESDDRIDTSDPEELLNRLANAMVALSKLDPSTSPLAPTSSLLNGDHSATTVRLYSKSASSNNDVDPLKPPEVMSFCKPRGSGKLGRVVICGDGSAVFDLPKKRAKRLLKAIQEEEENTGDGGLEYGLEIPSSLPEM